MNSEEFNTFYRRYYKVSVKIANGIVQSRFTAEDVTQEVFSYFYEIKRDWMLPAKKSFTHWWYGKQPIKEGTT
ncbi:MAG: hypothetical protein ACLURP_12800 [Ruminococcus sp.]